MQGTCPYLSPPAAATDMCGRRLSLALSANALLALSENVSKDKEWFLTSIWVELTSPLKGIAEPHWDFSHSTILFINALCKCLESAICKCLQKWRLLTTPITRLEGGILDAKLRHQRSGDCNLRQLAAASLNSIEEAVETINFSRAAPLRDTNGKNIIL